MKKMNDKEVLALILVFGCALFLASEIIDVLERGIMKDLAVHDVPAALLRESSWYKEMRDFARTGLGALIGVVPFSFVKWLFSKKRP